VAFVEAAQTWDVTARLGEITAPTLVVGGTRDPLIPAELARATAAGIAGARLVLLHGRGHLTTMLDPRSTQAIRTFLAS
jgi:pimeloyl-ACP methyl ester carboxylesterase